MDRQRTARAAALAVRYRPDRQRPSYAEEIPAPPAVPPERATARAARLVRAAAAEVARACRRAADEAPMPTTRVRSAPTGRLGQTAAICMVLGCGACLLLYREKSRAAILDGEIGRALAATRQARARTDLLQAEWSTLNAPDRLQQMADRYLALRPVAPSQFVALSSLPDRLAVPTTAAPPEAGATLAVDKPAVFKASVESRIAADVPAPAAAANPVPETLHGRPHPAPSLARVEPRPRTGHLATHLATVARFDLPHWLMEGHVHPMQVHAHTQVRVMSEPPHDLALPRETPLPLATPQPVRASTLRVIARPMLPPLRPALVAASPDEIASAPYGRPVFRPWQQRYGYAYGYGYGGPYGAPYRAVPYGYPYAGPNGGFYGGGP